MLAGPRYKKKSYFQIAAFIGASLVGSLLGDVACAQSPVIPTEESVKVSPATKTVINAGVKYLASKQHLDGSWYTKEGTAGHPVAMTGYSLIALMSAGNLPDQGIYKKNVALGMQYLLDSIQPNGQFRGVSGGQYMYNHGIATVALAELYGESHSPRLRPKLKQLIDVILLAQNPTKGGWRYAPRPTEGDLSVTVLQAVALRAAQEAGLAVPQEAVNKAIEYINACYNSAQGGFCYQPGQTPGFARTAGGIYALQVLGKYDDPSVKAGSEYLFAHAKEHGEHWTYGSYYAAPAQYMVGGGTWRSWYELNSQILLKSVQREGDLAFWDDKTQGPIFATAVYINVLSMPYHFLPLYQR